MTKLVIDLRSDTVTKPTPGMRAAMAAAEVGDDVFGEDPTVARLQERFAEMMGKEASLFVPSGTMGNQIALRVHARQKNADEVLCEAGSHVALYEGGGASAISGISVRVLRGKRGIFTAEALEAALPPDDQHWARAGTVVVENTSNRGGGTVWSVEESRAVAETARRHGLRAHLDGARLWNAAAALGVAVGELAQPFDTVTCCFSKGLGAPVGSALAGSREFIAEARRVRKMLGGGTRQAGILAAGALYALDHHLERLTEDHEKARQLAAGLVATGLFDVGPTPTNMIYFDFTAEAVARVDRQRFLTGCDDAGVKVNRTTGGQYRAVMHLDIPPESVAMALGIIESATRDAMNPPAFSGTVDKAVVSTAQY